MYSLRNDYSEGAHPNILEALTATNTTQEEGYGEDSYSAEAERLIKAFFNAPGADIHFVSGGTQANLLVIASMLKPWESVIAPETGHIFIHEAGAIEATGHRISTIPTYDGKITPEGIKAVVNAHTDEHMVLPKIVFISNSTELGTVYSGAELKAIRQVCDELNLYLYLDGARLGSALASDSNLSPEDLMKYTDVFYVGGTKNGALLGEAIIINNDLFKENFRFNMKQRGALLAKGRLTGIQFQELFRNDLFLENARHANAMAAQLAAVIRDCGYSFLTAPVSNQLFVIFPDKIITALEKEFAFYTWSRIDELHSSVRLVTSWATKQELVDNFSALLKLIS